MNLDAKDVHAQIVGRIDANLTEIHRARIDVRHLAPGQASVIRTIRAAFFLVLDSRVQNIGIGAIDIEADAAQRTGGHAAGQLRPGAAGIARFVDAAARSAAVESPGGAPALVGGGIEHLVVAGILHELGGAGVFIDKEHVRPRQAAVGRFEHAAFLARPPQTTQRRDVHDVVIHGIDDDSRDVSRITQPHVFPRLAAVARLVDAVPPGAALAIVVFARAHPHEIRVVGRDGDVADRHHIVEIVEEDLPGGAVVDGLPQPAARGPDVEDRGIRFENRKIIDAPAHGGRADVAKRQSGKYVR
jgi:hypothetical protein